MNPILCALATLALLTCQGTADLKPYRVIDNTQGLDVGTLAMPKDWTGASRVDWNYANVSFPVQISARLSAPDGSAWVEFFPAEMFYWLAPHDAMTPKNAKSLGMIHSPEIGAREALTRFVIQRYRNRRDLKILGFRPIRNLAEAFGQKPIPGDSLAARVRYTDGTKIVDEEFFALLTAPLRIPYHGPQGTTYEFHRILAFAHSIGAKDGKLDKLAPTLGSVASSFRINPAWEKRQAAIMRRLSDQFQKYLAQGYSQIAAAGQLSRTISANNDAMLGNMEAQRLAQNRTFEARRQAETRVDREPSDAFDQYIRGTERMKDPYWGTSEQDYTAKYHWTDGSGNYRHSNDASFNPNIGGTQNWQLMEPAK